MRLLNLDLLCPPPGLLRRCTGLLLLTMKLGAATDLPTDTDSYSLRVWRVREGLSHDETTLVRQDEQGYLWVGSSAGTMRFDGARFVAMRAEGEDQRKAPIIRAAASTSRLGLVLAPDGTGLLQWKDGRLKPLPFASELHVNALFAEEDGSLWIGCDNGDILRLRAGLIENLGQPDSAIRRPLAYFAKDEDGHVWVACGHFLGYVAEGSLVSAKLGLDSSELRIVSSRSGGPWIITQDAVWKLDQGHLRRITPLPPLLGAHYIRSLLEDRDGGLWLGTRSQGLLLVKDGRCALIPSSSEDILSLWEDNEGDIWVATNGGGLDRLRRKQFTFYNRSNGLRDDFSHTVCEDAAGDLWFGNRDGGVVRLHEGRPEVLNEAPGWQRFNAMSVYPSGPSGVLVTAGTRVFHVGGPNETKPTYIAAIPQLSIMRVTLLQANGDYWVSIDPDRLGRLSKGEFKVFGPEEGLRLNLVRSLCEDAQGRLYVGSGDGRLYTLKEEHFEALTLDAKTDLKAIQAIFPDRQGRLWLGTAGDGLGLYDQGRFQLLGREAGLPDTRISQIIADDEGGVWLGSVTGLFRLRYSDMAEVAAGRRRSLHPTLLGLDDGVQPIACLGLFGPSAWKSRDHRLWFATRQGILSFDPATIVNDRPPPPVSITSIQADGQPLVPAPDLDLPTGLKRLTLGFSVLCLSTPDRVRIRCRIDGFDQDWTEAAADRSIAYPGLPSGDYQLHVICSLGNGVWSENETLLQLHVIPAWWQRLWVQTGCLLLLLGGVALIVRKRSHRRLRQKLERLRVESEIERERSRIARNIHDDLGASLTRISLLTQYAKGNPGAQDQGGLMDEIYRGIREITGSMDEIVWAVNPRHDNLESLAVYLSNYALAFLRPAGIRCRLIMPDSMPPLSIGSQARHHLILCVKEALGNILRHAKADTVTISLTLEGQKLVLEIADNGRGFAAAEAPRSGGGNGLENMRTRMQELGGVLLITAGPEGGTVVTLSLELRISSSTEEEDQSAPDTSHEP